MKPLKISKKFICIITLLAGGYLFLRFSPYQKFAEFKNQSYSTRIYDCHDHLIQVLPLEDGLRREWTPLNEIPKEITKTFIKAEDRRFYFHPGVDLTAITSAAFENVKEGRTVRGASTITMQLVKIISPSSGSRSFRKKIADIFNAFRLEARLSKKQILELYLNTVPFGMNTQGVTSAARSFYGKELCDLTSDEIKCLSVIPRRPSSYNPILNPENCAQRAGVPLEAAKNAYLYKYPFYMPHYVNYIKKMASEQNRKLPYELKLKADLEIQIVAQEFLQSALTQANSSRIANGALLLIDNSDCSVIAWIGNGNWYDSDNGGQIDGVTVQNQPGSSMKPFLYALGIETSNDDGNPKYYPSKIIADIPQEFGSSNLYIPANFNNRFNGPIRFRVALASSLNIPAVSILNDLGVNEYLDCLYDLGFDSLKHGGKEADLGLALGAGEVSLSELVPAFSVFTRDGKYIPLEHSGKEEKQVYSSDTARLLCSILSDKASRALGFGYTQTFQTEYPSIFKTGTANQYQNIIALGGTKRYTIGVWMGNFSGQTVVGKTGSSLPAWVAKNVLDRLENDPASKNLKKDFPEPENWKKIRICSLSGLPADSCCPATVFEYVKAGTPQKKCDWHVNENNKVSVKYPPEYQSWILQNNISGNIDYYAAPVQIQTPQNGAIFYYSNSNPEYQAIPVEVTGGRGDELEVYYDNNPVKKIGRPFSFKIPVEKGRHNLLIQCEGEERQISFEVK